MHRNNYLGWVSLPMCGSENNLIAAEATNLI
jgi:hypothetical protein